MVSQPFSGAGYFIRGLRLLTNPGIRRFVAIPLAINITVFALLLTLVGSQFNALIDSLLPSLPGWLSWLQWLYDLFYWFLWSIAATIAAVVIFFTFSIVANLIAADHARDADRRGRDHVDVNPGIGKRLEHLGCDPGMRLHSRTDE